MKKDIERLKNIRNTINEAIASRSFLHGLTQGELKRLCMKLKCPIKVFNKAFGINTVGSHVCSKCHQLEGIYYNCDVELAFAKIYKYRTVRYGEWD